MPNKPRLPISSAKHTELHGPLSAQSHTLSTEYTSAPTDWVLPLPRVDCGVVARNWPPI